MVLVRAHQKYFGFIFDDSRRIKLFLFVEDDSRRIQLFLFVGNNDDHIILCNFALSIHF